jgi:hypothetical protein
VRIVIAALAALTLTGCATRGVFLLSDGRIPSDDPLLKEQLEKDLTICNAEAQKANLAGGFGGNVNAASRYIAVGQVGRGCMAEKGYVFVPHKEDVESKQEELREATAEKARLEAAPSRSGGAAKPKPAPVPPPQSQ